VSFHLSGGGDNVFHVIGRAEKDILGNVDGVLSRLIRHGRRQPPKIFWAFSHEKLHRRLVRDGCSESTMDRCSFGLN
jgi:hypothetical protein